ncbi:MAG TPA: glycosyltransferase [Stellaceae bacterium]|nr:glycosyltransferase [Stellaceae bacterium]
MSRRLLQAIAGARHGGAETFFVRLAGALQRAGETQLVLIRRDADRRRALHAAGIEVGELGFAGRFDLATRFGFRRAIAAWRPHVVLTWMSRATIVCPRGDFVHVARLGGYYDLKYYRHCDHLIANTRAIVDYAIAAGWPRSQIDYLPNFVPDAAAAAAPARRPGDPLLALAVGRLHPNKGFALLLEALALTRGVRLAIAGDGPLRGELEQRARALGIAPRVQFLGWREDVPALLAEADMFVCPSLHEPLGNVVIEAWSAAVPVIATASDGPAALIENEVSGLLVPLPGRPGGGPVALAAAIERLCRSPEMRRQLGQRGRHAYEAKYTEAAIVARYRRFFDRMVSA